MLQRIVDDVRPILHIITHGEDGYYWRVGQDAITRIVPYNEHGQGAYVLWFAVYEGDRIASRVNGAFVDHVKYQEAEICLKDS